MVSLRCKMMVEQELKKIGINYVRVELGMVEFLEEITKSKKDELKKRLTQIGLEVMDNKRNILIEQIKLVITHLIHHSDDLPKINYSEYISKKLGYNYTYLANIFSETQGTTVQQFIILHKIERVKELLLYDELSLSEISFMLHYSSSAHLSGQFKKVTGLTPSYFKKIGLKRKLNLENL